MNQELSGRGQDFVRRFSLLSLVVMLILGVILAFGTSRIIEGFMIERAKVATVHLVQVQASQHLSRDDFSAADFNARKPTFEKFFDEISTPEIVRVKIYNQERMIIYSNEERLIGQSFEGNPELEEALSGEAEIEINRDLEEKEEHLFELGFRGLMEIYVPVSLMDGGVNGVVEVYQVIDPIDRAIRSAQLTVAGLITVGLALLYFALNGIVRGASRTISVSEDELKKANAELQKRLEEVEKFAKYSVGRELRLVEQKDRIKELEAEIERLRSQK